jgi:hypothetical protein
VSATQASSNTDIGELIAEPGVKHPSGDAGDDGSLVAGRAFGE